MRFWSHDQRERNGLNRSGVGCKDVSVLQFLNGRRMLEADLKKMRSECRQLVARVNVFASVMDRRKMLQSASDVLYMQFGPG